MQINLNPTSERGASRDAVNRPRETLGDSHLISLDPRSRFGLVCDLLCCRGNSGFVFTHGHFGFQKQRATPVCMILMILLEARPRAGAIKATPATDLMVFPAVPDHSRPQVRLALSCRPRLGFGSRGLVVRSLRHLPMNSSRGSTR